MIGVFFTTLITFVLSWWIILHISLPFGVKRDYNPGKYEDYGAPNNQNLGKKLIITTILAMIVTSILFYVVEVSGWVNINQMVFENENF